MGSPRRTSQAASGRHVVELHHVDDVEAASYNADILRAARAIEERLRPLKVNDMTLASRVPRSGEHRFARDPGSAQPAPVPAVDVN